MTGDVPPRQRFSEESSTAIVGVVLLFTTLFAPFVMYIQSSFYYSNVHIIALTWMWNSEWGAVGMGSDYNPFIYFIDSLLFTCLRYLFVYMMVYLYKGKTTQKRVILLGIASELQLVVMSLPSILSMLIFPTTGYILIIVPIPFLLIMGLLLIHFLPPMDFLMWIEKEEPHQWWIETEKDQTEETKPKETKSTPSKEPESP